MSYNEKCKWFTIYHYSGTNSRRTEIPVRCESIILICSSSPHVVRIVGGINHDKVIENGAGGRVGARSSLTKKEELLKLYKRFGLELEPENPRPTPKEMEDFFNDA